MRILPAVTLLCLASSVAAQDMIGISWSGQTYSINSYTAAAVALPNAGANHNAMAADAAGNLWTSSRTGVNVYSISTVDPVTGAVTQVFTGTPDLRGMAGGETGYVWAAVDVIGGDELHRLDTATGLSTIVGSMGASGIQGLAEVGNELYAWDIGAGLMIVDKLTGVATDVDTTVGGSGGIQFITTRGDGVLVGGRDDLFTIDLATGTTTLIGNMGAFDIRGAESIEGSIVPFGSACAAATGPGDMNVTGMPQAGQILITQSANHNPGGLGVLILGFSVTEYQTFSLPFNVDGILGTSGCEALVAPDATLFSSASAAGLVSAPVVLPANVAGYQFYVQHAVFEGGTPEWSWSNGVAVQIAY